MHISFFFQLVSFLIVEHDPLLYKDATGIIEFVSQAMSDAANEAAVLLYPPGIDAFLEDLTRNAISSVRLR